MVNAALPKDVRKGCPSERQSSIMKDETVGLGQRHVQMGLMFLGVTTTYMCAVNLSVCLVSMTATDDPNGYEVFPWTQAQRGLVLSSFFLGYTLTQVPGGLAAQRFGPRRCLLLGVGAGGLVSALLPLGARWGGWQALCGLRALQGLLQGFVFPSTHCMLGRWVPPLERGRLSAAVYCGSSLGSVSVMAGAGALAASPLGWPAGLYLPGAAALLWAAAWLRLGADSPASCGRISQRERDYIQRALGDSTSGEKRLPVPWRSVLTSLPLLCILAASCASSLSHYTMITQLPNFMRDVMHFDIKKNGLFSALPYVGLFCTSLLVAWLSQVVSERKIMALGVSRKVFNSCAQWGGAVALLVLGLCRVSPMVAVGLLFLVISLESGVLAGFHVNYVDLSPNFSGVLLGIGNGASYTMAIFAPILVSWVVGDTHGMPQQDLESRWGYVFIIAAAALFVGNLVFILGGSVQVQPWNKPTPSKPSVERGEVAVLLVPPEEKK